MYLEYVGIRVTDLERSMGFYTRLLGLQEAKRRDMTQWGLGIWVLLRDPISGHQLELNWYPPGSRYATPYAPGEALDHVGFIVDDVEATYRELVARGAEPAVHPSEADGWTAYVKDPDGNWIEIYQLTEPKSGATPEGPS
jgi:lactoylglutathione lyase